MFSASCVLDDIKVRARCCDLLFWTVAKLAYLANCFGSLINDTWQTRHAICYLALKAITSLRRKYCSNIALRIGNNYDSIFKVT